MAAILASGARTDALRFVRVPTSVMHGTADILIRPAGGRATARAIDGASLRMIEGMGHDMPEGAWPVLLDGIDAVVSRADDRQAAKLPPARPSGRRISVPPRDVFVGQA